MWSCQITKNQINLDLIEIIQFSFKIYDLCVWVVGWMDGWVDGHIMSNQVKRHRRNQDFQKPPKLFC